VKAEHMGQYVRGGQPGAVIVGSHVDKTTRQLNALLTMPGTAGVEVDVDRIVHDGDALLASLLEEISALHADGKTPVIFTSRGERSFASQAERLEFGVAVSRFLMDIVQNLPADLGFLISKGGITSNDVLSTGLNLTTSRVVGQILPGCSVVRCPEDHPRFAHLPVVIFPGNVGDDDSLARAYEYLALSEDNTRAASA
jgi:uncharacterized protein YgbK (DUF1537 family)